MSLRHTQFVDHQSASLYAKRAIYLTTDHSGLNKFYGPEDENFLLVRPEIQRVVQMAPRMIQERYRCMGHAPNVSNLSLIKASLTFYKHTLQLLKRPKKHKYTRITKMNRKRNYSRLLHQITGVRRTWSQ